MVAVVSISCRSHRSVLVGTDYILPACLQAFAQGAFGPGAAYFKRLISGGLCVGSFALGASVREGYVRGSYVWKFRSRGLLP